MNDDSRSGENDPKFADFPYIRDYLTAVDVAIKANENMSFAQASAAWANLMIQFHRDILLAEAVWRAAEGLEYQDPEEEWRRIVLEHVDKAQKKERVRPLGLKRATYVQAAYDQLLNDGEINAPMERAVEMAAVMEMADDAGDLDDPEMLFRYFAYYKDRGSELNTGAIHKSIQRYRQSINGKEVLYFDRNTLTWSAHKAEDAFLPSLPKGRGRPRRN